jgi:hypothetical protein
MKSVVIVLIEGVYKVAVTSYDWSDFPTFEMATQFCNDMQYKIVPLNSKRGI